MKITIIGTGKVGSAFAVELRKAGHEIIALVDNSVSTARKIGKITGCRNVYSKINSHAISRSDLILICVKDSDIGNVVKELRKIKVAEKTVVAHTSGVLPSGILKTSGVNAPNLASFHPIQTIPCISYSDNRMLRKIYFGIEGGKYALRILKRLIKDLNSKFLLIPGNRKPEYHLSCVLASNFAIAGFYLSAKLSKSLRIPEKKLFESQRPLIMNTIENVQRYGAVKSITGPVSRGDTETVINHLDLLHSKFPNFVEYYKTVSEILLEVSLKKNKKLQSGKFKKIFDR